MTWQEDLEAVGWGEADALDRLYVRLERADRIEKEVLEYIEPWRRDESWRATEWQERLESVLASSPDRED